MVTFLWWAGLVVCVVGLARSRMARRGRGSGEGDAAAEADADAVPERSGPRLPVALGGGAPESGTPRRLTFSSFDREILAPLLQADVGPDGVRCPGCVDGSVRRYLHRPDRAPDEVEGDLWCASCRRHMTLRGPAEGLAFDDPLAHLDDVRRREVAGDLDEYLGGLDLLWTRGELPQQLRRTGTAP